MYFIKHHSLFSLLLLLTLFLLSSSSIGTKSCSKLSIGDQLEMAPISKAHKCTNRSGAKAIVKVTDEDSSAAEGTLNVYCRC